MRIHPFHDGDSHSTFYNLRERTVREIEALDNEYVLKASEVELEHYYIDQVSVNQLTLDASGYYIDEQKSAQIDVSRDFLRGNFGDEQAYVKGTALH